MFSQSRENVVLQTCVSTAVGRVVAEQTWNPAKSSNQQPCQKDTCPRSQVQRSPPQARGTFQLGCQGPGIPYGMVGFFMKCYWHATCSGFLPVRISQEGFLVHLAWLCDFWCNLSRHGVQIPNHTHRGAGATLIPNPIPQRGRGECM